MADHVGSQLGNYHLVRLLGRGGFAEVYLGEHVHLNTQAAVKVLYANLESDELEKFRNEARTIALLEHPHIVRVLDFGVEGGVPFLVMNYAPNGTLRHRYPRGKPLALNAVLPYVKQICDALQYAHNEKLIHRDIKPENMLLGRHDEVLLSDFGLATIAQSAHSMSKQDVAGTVTYMAPEQFRGKPVTASDQYALGVVVYEWLSGDYPFHGYAIETALQHILTPPVPLHEKISTVSPAVEEAVMRALEKEPYKRFENIQAFASALERASTAEYSPSVSISNSVVKPALAAEESFRTIALSSTAARSSIPSIIPLGTILCNYHGHTAAVTSLAWSADGRYIASGSNDKTVQVWNALTTDQGIIYRGHASWVHAVAWSPNETYIASGSWDNTVQIWHASTGSKFFTYRGHLKNVNTVAWFLDSAHMASGGYDQTVQVWDVTSGSHIFTYSGHSSAINSVAWSPDGKRIASGSLDQTVQVWDATTKGHAFIYHGHSGGVHAVAWSPNGKRIASGSQDGTIQVWDEAKTGGVFSKSKVVTYHGHASSVLTLAWSPDGKHIASGDKSGAIHIWETQTGNHVFTYGNHAKQVNALAWSPDGRFIASASETVQVWFAA